jgi:hypothetical protein
MVSRVMRVRDGRFCAVAVGCCYDASRCDVVVTPVEALVRGSCSQECARGTIINIEAVVIDLRM